MVPFLMKEVKRYLMNILQNNVPTIMFSGKVYADMISNTIWDLTAL